MFKVTIPFTDEVLFNAQQYADDQTDDVIVNRFDEVRGTISLHVKSFRIDDLTVYMVHLQAPESALISIYSAQCAWVKSYLLGGQLSVQSISLNEHTHYSLMPRCDDFNDVVIQGDARLFLICLADGALKKLLKPEDETMLMQCVGNIQGRATTPAMAAIINNIADSIQQNRLHRMLLAAKTLELLFLDLEQLNQAGGAATDTIKAYDLEKLKLAKALVAGNLQSPLSLVELAHKVGLNDFKLKKGFKAAFGTTVFGYLFELRMQKAKVMLSQHSVSEVAHVVGYKNAHHFTVAFKKEFRLSAQQDQQRSRA